ncbi:MAG: SDR family NAD(P)-dependent oxidoreductase [Flavobacteriales bacterium]|jgi:3-oxoacyl-[acyl-carrier protein] reductase|nr:SDR family NAD(P)-dependent oxidoreductase [Flavobacteriales bacterium]
MDLQGKIALVTGGSNGIGKQTALQLINEGATVYITGRNKERLNAAALEIGAKPILADSSNQSDVDRVFTQITRENESFDILINNAGFGAGWAELGELNMEDMISVYQTNVFGAAMMGQAAANIFKTQKSGNIINIGSTASLKGYAKGSIYASSKFALRGLSQCWQADLRPYNVRVMHVNPSEVTTAFGKTDGLMRAEVENKLRPQEIADVIISQLKMDDRGFVPEVTVWATNPW